MALKETRDINARIKSTPRPPGRFEEGVVGRVGQRIGGKAGALVGDFHVYPMRRKPTYKMHFFSEIFLIAVNNGVYQGFVHSQVDAENIALGPML